MSYTPTNWQTGDTITAEKLNNLESGVDNAQWKSEEPTQLFSETVITEEGDYGNFAQLSYSEPLTADELIVTFDGVEYTCQRTQVGGFNAYGGIGQTGPDFSEYPFALTSDDGLIGIYTETAGEHTVSASDGSITSISYSQDFSDGIIEATNIFVIHFNEDTGEVEESWDSIVQAFNAGKHIIGVEHFGAIFATHYLLNRDNALKELQLSDTSLSVSNSSLLYYMLSITSSGVESQSATINVTLS